MSLGEAGFGGGLGYQRNDGFTRDEMNAKARYQEAASGLFGTLKQAYNSSSIMPSSQPAVKSSGPATLAEKLAPNQSFKPPPINPASLAATGSMSQNKGNYQAIGVVEKQVQNVQGNLDRTMKTAQNMLTEEVGNVAASQGLSRSAAMNSVAAPGRSETLSAGVSVLLESKGGAIGSVLEIAQNIGGDLKKLEPGVVEGLVQQAVQNLSDQSKKQNVEIETQVGLKQAKPQFQNLTLKDAQDLLNNNWKNEKEYKELASAQEALDDLREENELADAKIKRENLAPEQIQDKKPSQPDDKVKPKPSDDQTLTASAVFSLTDFSARGATFKPLTLTFMDETQRVAATINDPSLKQAAAVYDNEIDINKLVGSAATRSFNVAV